MKTAALMLMAQLAPAVLALGCSADGYAQESLGDYPTKPVVVVVPNEAIGMETEMRLFGQSILESTGKRFIVDKKGGAGGTIGTNYVARAVPDGYTLLAANSGFAITPSIYPDLPYDNIKDFAPITLLDKHAYLWVVNPSAPYKTARDYIAFSRANPDQLNFGTSGEGSASHLPGVLLHYMTGTKVTFVHYKQASQRLVDVIAGRIQAAVVTFGTGMPLVKSGKLRAIAVTTNARVPVAPDLPTLDEQGAAGYDFSSWTGLVAPARVPGAIITKLNTMWVQAIKDPSVIKKLESDGTIMIGTTPQAFQQFLIAETDRYRKLVQATGMKMDDK